MALRYEYIGKVRERQIARRAMSEDRLLIEINRQDLILLTYKLGQAPYMDRKSVDLHILLRKELSDELNARP